MAEEKRKPTDMSEKDWQWHIALELSRKIIKEKVPEFQKKQKDK